MKRILYISTVIFMAAILAITVSCSKDDFSLSHPDEKSSNEILSFDSHKDFSSKLEEILAMSTEELKSYENQIGYKSFGRICEEFYSSINFEDFTTSEELKSFVDSESRYLKFVKDENGEIYLETVLSDSPYRYFINNDRLFKIKDKVYKVFEDGLIVTSFDNIDALKRINTYTITDVKLESKMRVLPSYQKTSFTGLQLKDAAYNCGRSDSDDATSGRDRTKITISIDYKDTYDIDQVPMTIYENKVLIRPYKKTLGVWYWCTRTLSCDIKVAVDVNTSSGWERGFYYKSEPGKKDSKLEYIMSGGIVSWGSWARYDMHYAGYDCWAKSPDTHRVILQCNTSLF